MIFDVTRKIVFRQGEFESLTVEAHVVIDTEQDDVAESEAAQVVRDHLDDLVYQDVVDAAGTTSDENSFSHYYQKEIEVRRKEKN